MLLGTILGLTSLWLLWFEKLDEKLRLHFSVAMASYYWLTQMGAILFPGTALDDPEFARAGEPPHQLIVDLVMLAMLITAYVLENQKQKKLSSK